MRTQIASVILVISIFAGGSSTALISGALAGSRPLTAAQQEKRLGPKPTPHWYWRWQAWRLGEGYAKGHQLQRNLRPRRAPRRVPNWAWRRLRFVVVARMGGGPTAQPAQPSSVPSSDENYTQAISYTQTRPAFSPAREIDVASASELRNAVANLQPGDLVKATADFTVTSSSTGAALVISKQLAAPAVIDLSGHSVKFVYSGGQDYPAVWLKNSSNLRIYGGEASTADTGGACIVDYGSQNVTWWGFTAHDCGGIGFAAAAIGGPVDHNDFQGTIWKIGQHLAWDNHQEKGSGLHGANLFDQPTTLAFTNNRFAFDMHDIPTGACVEFGNDQTAPASGNVLYLRCVNASFVSTLQTGGNALQLWGNTSTIGLDIKYLEADNLQGYALFTHVYPGQTCQGVTVEQGRASNTNQNPRYAGQSPWDTSHGIVYQHAS
jgi:hypothetical protein